MKLCPLCKRTWDDAFRVCPIDGLALQASAVETDPHTGSVVGQARVGQKIADGDHGPVYRADDAVLGPVAIQFIGQDRLSSPILLEAFEDAVKMASRLNHPNVVRVHSLEHAADGGAAVLMEYVPGGTLESYRRDHPSLDVQQAVRIVRESAEGILAAHRMSMLHGSLQPSRILIAPDGATKVAGFHRSGLRDEVFSSEPAPPGLAYFAPERTGIIRDIPVPDYRADVYSLGAILYELLAGRLPYDSKNLQDLAAAMEAGPPLPASFSNPQVSPTLSRVILKALSRHPGDRHKSVEDLIRELEAARQPVREPERETPAARYSPPRYAESRDDSGLFSAPTPQPKRESAESLWPEVAQSKQSVGEGSFFNWFKTRGSSRPGSGESGRKQARTDDSFFPRKGPARAEEDSEERTVVVSGKRGGGRRRSIVDTFTSFGRNQDMTGTDALPRRRFSSRAYILMAAGLILLVAVIAVLFFIFGGTATGKLTIDSSPPGAQIFLNEEFRGNTPLIIPEIKPDTYRLRLQLEGYEISSANLDVGPKADVQRSFVLNKLAAPLALLPPPPPPPTNTTVTPTGPVVTPGGKTASFEGIFSDALRNRNFFPPANGNAWDVLQAWRQREAAAPSANLDQAQQSFCREVERLGLEKLDQRDFQFARNLLEQVRSRMPGQPCAGGLQSRYDETISRSLSDLRISLNAAMTRQNFVTPEQDNALKYARLILHIDSQDAEAKSLESDLYSRALEQARAKSEARDHQEALNIYLQLKSNYPNPQGGLETINQGIERERQRLSLLGALKVPYSVQVKHGHSFFRLTKRDCTGVLRADGFSIEFQSTGEHSFKLAYDLLKSVSYGKSRIVLEGSTIPDGKIELEQADNNPSPSLAEVYAKIEEYRKLRGQYLQAKPAGPGK